MSKAIGDYFEHQAQALLLKAGFQIIASNYRVARVGEIDIIACRGDLLLCVEVKARRSHRFGTATQMVNLAKQRKLIATMGYFLMDNKSFANYAIRFDVIAFDDGVPTWLEAAFLAE